MPNNSCSNCRDTVRLLWVVFCIPILASLLMPAAREMHGMCLRMLFQLRGETMVQGQPPGCVIYTVPNVVFTEEHQAELRKTSATSPDNYALASSFGDYSKLEAPPVSTWTNHALLKWGALQLAWIAIQESERTNENRLTNESATALREVVLQLVRHAQSVDPTNGAHWLAEAALQFAAKDDVAALTSLRSAASNKVWQADTENTFTHMTRLFVEAGFSKLDAAAVANNLSPTTYAMTLQTPIRRNMARLMESAVRERDDEEFNRLFQLLVSLRQARWDEKNHMFDQSLPLFHLTDELVDAMAVRVGTTMPAVLGPDEPDTSDARRRLRQQVFQNFLDRYDDAQTVARYRGQSDSNDVIKSLRRELSRSHTRSLGYSWAMSTVAGMVAVLMLALLAVFILTELPFLWLRKGREAFGCWPRNWKFWLTVIAAVALGTFVFTEAQLAMGLHSIVGFRIDPEPEGMSAESVSLATALFLCVTWFAVLLSARKLSKKPMNSWLVIAGIAATYCTLTIVAGLLREQTVELIKSALF